MTPLSLEHVSKSFGGQKIIDGLSFTVPEHSVFGFIGENGAGKTTTMKMILGLLKPDTGSIAVCGEPVSFGQTKSNRFVGYLPDVPEFYSYMRPREYLRLCGEICGLTAEETRRRSAELLELVGLSGANKKIGGFSRGMKQRLGIAQALIHEPRLLICDEPTSALDPVGRKEVLEILSRVREKTTVLFSTHILSDVERICDRIAVLHKGRVALSGTLPEIKARHKRDELLIEFSEKAEKERFLAAVNATNLAAGCEKSENSLVLRTQNTAETEAAILAVLSQNRILPLRLEIREPALETLFLEAIQS